MTTQTFEEDLITSNYSTVFTEPYVPVGTEHLMNDPVGENTLFINLTVYSGLKSNKQIESDFNLLVGMWHEERKYMSNPKDIFACPAYLKIVNDLKDNALSFIFKDLEEKENNPDNWFDALKKLTGAQNVVDKTHFGNRKLMARDWLDWATSNGRI